MKRFPITCLVLWIFVLLNPCELFAQESTPEDSTDQIVFKNGDTLAGTVLRATSTAVEFSNSSVGNLTLNWNDLQTVHFRHPTNICTGSAASHYKHNFRNATVYPIVADKELTLRIKEEGQSEPVILQDVQSVSNHGTCGSKWSIAAFKVDAAILSATQKQQTYGGELNLVRNWHSENDGWNHQRTMLDLLPSYDEKRKNNNPGSATITRVYDGKLQHLFFITSNNFYESTVAHLYHNNSLGIYLEQFYGGGPGWIVHNVELNADLMFIGEHFYAVNPSLGLVGAELSASYTFDFKLKKLHLSLTPKAIMRPVFNASRAWQTQGRLDLAIPMTRNLQLDVATLDYYVENAPPAFQKNYFKTSIGFEYHPATNK